MCCCSLTGGNFDAAAMSTSRYLPVESAMPGTTLGLIALKAFETGGTLYGAVMGAVDEACINTTCDWIRSCGPIGCVFAGIAEFQKRFRVLFFSPSLMTDRRHDLKHCHNNGFVAVVPASLTLCEV